jgi:hypothetical protein
VLLDELSVALDALAAALDVEVEPVVALLDVLCAVWTAWCK